MPSVVITGASQGIGQAIAERFAVEDDCSLALIARNAARLEQVARACESRGAKAAVYPCDVTDDDALMNVATSIEQAIGAPDLLVNNAGMFEPGTVTEVSPADFRRQLDVNVVSGFVLTRALLPAMLERGSGTVIFMGSVASLKAYPGSVAYCTGKHAVLGLARVLREETRDSGVRVTTMLPGATRTPSWDGVGLPDERFMPPDDIAEAVATVFRMSDRTVVEEILLRPQKGDI